MNWEVCERKLSWALSLDSTALNDELPQNICIHCAVFMSSERVVKKATVFPVAGYEDLIQEEAPEEGWHYR
jgi:hypothetical protein